LACLLIASLIVGCVPSAPVTEEPETPATEPPEEEEQEPTEAPEITVVKIGAIYPLTGALAPTGLEVKNAIELAVEIINNEYPDLALPLAETAGLPNLGGAKIEMIFADHELVPEKALSEAERLITEEDVKALIGAYASSCTATASQASERLGIPYLNAISTSARLHTRGFEWFFRTSPHDGTCAESMFQFLVDMNEQKGADLQTVATLYENTLFGTDSSDSENEMANKYGFQVVANIPYPAESADMTSEIQTLKAADPDVVLPTSYIADAILMTRTFKDLDFNPEGVLAQDAGHIEGAFLETVGKDGEYICSREVFALDLAEKKPLVGQVNEMYKERYERDMDGANARGFVGMLVLADAINRAGSTEPEAIRDALKATDMPPEQIIMPWDGVKFDPDTGQNMLGKGIIVQAQEGQYWSVWPFDLAAKEVIWPMPEWSER
jgi:branched-chain amino acid transport system substrate-binding protein